MDRDRFALPHASTSAAGANKTAGRLISSRLKGRHLLAKAIDHHTGPVLLTGDYGVGKTRLRQAIEADSKPGRSWVNIDVAPATTVPAFYSLLNHALGVDDTSLDRAKLSEYLGLERLDKSEWILAVDEAHNLDDLVLEEIRLLSNRLGTGDGFAAILLVGHTTLVRRLSFRANEGLAERITAHVHLSPFDADEVLELLKHHDARREWPAELVERIHIVTEGRPGRIARLLPLIDESAIESAPAAKTKADAPAELKSQPVESFELRPEPLVGPSKPPLVVEDGLIEVGWDSDSDVDELLEAEDELESADSLVAEMDSDHEDPEPIEEGEERLNDHYAALQAWQDWSAAHEKPGDVAQRRWPEVTESQDETPSSPREKTPNLWVDEEHGFAPLSRLFGRKTQENEAE